MTLKTQHPVHRSYYGLAVCLCVPACIPGTCICLVQGICLRARVSWTIVTPPTEKCPTVPETSPTSSFQVSVLMHDFLPSQYPEHPCCRAMRLIFPHQIPKANLSQTPKPNLSSPPTQTASRICKPPPPTYTLPGTPSRNQASNLIHKPKLQKLNLFARPTHSPSRYTNQTSHLPPPIHPLVYQYPNQGSHLPLLTLQPNTPNKYSTPNNYTQAQPNTPNNKPTSSLPLLAPQSKYPTKYPTPTYTVPLLTLQPKIPNHIPKVNLCSTTKYPTK